MRPRRFRPPARQPRVEGAVCRPTSSRSCTPTPRRSSRATRRSARRCCRCCTSCSRSTATSPGRGIEFCAEVLDLTTAEVSGVATFYTQYKRHPNGDYTVGVCTNTLCAVMGGDQIWDVGQRAPRHRPRRDHRGRQDHPRAGRVQRGVRLRAGRDGQLGVLRQPDARVAPTGSSTTCAPARTVAPDPRRRQGVHFKEVSRVLAGLRRRPRRRGRRRRPGLPAGPAARPRARLDRAGRTRPRADGRRRRAQRAADTSRAPTAPTAPPAPPRRTAPRTTPTRRLRAGSDGMSTS